MAGQATAKLDVGKGNGATSDFTAVFEGSTSSALAATYEGKLCNRD